MYPPSLQLIDSGLVLLLDIITSDLDLEFIGLTVSEILAIIDLVICREPFVYPYTETVATDSTSISTATQPDGTFTSTMVVVTVGEEPMDVMRCTTMEEVSASILEQGVDGLQVIPMLLVQELGLSLQFREEE